MADSLDSELIKETAVLVEEFKMRLFEILQNDRKLKPDSRTLNSLRLVVHESSKYVALQGGENIYYVIHGRGPGRFPPPDPITGKFKIPFPVAERIAKYGNKAQYAPVAAAFDKAYQELIEKVKKKAGQTSLAYIMRIGVIRNVG